MVVDLPDPQIELSATSTRAHPVYPYSLADA